MYFFIPAARSRTTTLLRLHPSYRFYNDSNKHFCQTNDVKEHLVNRNIYIKFKTKFTSGM